MRNDTLVRCTLRIRYISLSLLEAPVPGAVVLLGTARRSAISV